ncbi:MAG: hypothetical protein EPO11_04570 [Gammaproteobacteria bacterium]|nr:MAG: hypothetical protein EPO11_04570 [Gammaproteobacteria bacterium]
MNLNLFPSYNQPAIPGIYSISALMCLIAGWGLFPNHFTVNQLNFAIVPFTLLLVFIAFILLFRKVYYYDKQSSLLYREITFLRHRIHLLTQRDINEVHITFRIDWSNMTGDSYMVWLGKGNYLKGFATLYFARKFAKKIANRLDIPIYESNTLYSGSKTTLDSFFFLILDQINDWTNVFIRYSYFLILYSVIAMIVDLLLFYAFVEIIKLTP